MSTDEKMNNKQLGLSFELEHMPVVGALCSGAQEPVTYPKMYLAHSRPTNRSEQEEMLAKATTSRLIDRVRLF